MITVIEQQRTKLERYIWEFYFNEFSKHLVLRSYYFQERETPRHKWTSTIKYDGSDKRHNNIDIKDVPLPEEIKQQAVDEFTKDICAVKPNG